MKRKTPEDYRLLAGKMGLAWLGPEVANTKEKTKWSCYEGHEWQAVYGKIQQGRGCPVCANRIPRAPEAYHILAARRGFEWLGPEVANSKTKTRWRCSEGHEWLAIYSNIRGGKGCPVCANRTPRTPGDYLGLAAKRGFEWLGPEVPNVNAGTWWRCRGGHNWQAGYAYIQQGSGCPACAGNARRTEGDYLALATDRGFIWLGPEVPNAQTKTMWRCDQGHEWWARYSNIKQGNGCPVCASIFPKAPDDYHTLATDRGFNWLGPEVANVVTKTMWRCDQGHEWWAVYSSIQQGTGCPACSGNARKTIEDYHMLATERGFEWLGKKAVSTQTKTRWCCSEGHEWLAKYSHVQQGSGCPVCSESKGETAVATTLDMLFLSYKRQARFRKCRNKQPLPFDFFFTFQGIRFLVEYDGQQHFESVGFFGGNEALETRHLHDQIKDEFAAKYGFTLIRIPYTVENIQTHLIQAIADACGIEFGDVLATAKQEETAVRSQPASAQPATGIQMPLI